MARTFVSQPTQIFHTEYFDDSYASGVGLETGSLSLETDLNGIRSQIRRLLWAGVSGSWYNDITTPSGSIARGLNTINVDLANVEQTKFLFRRQNLNVISIATGSNVALLSASLGSAPASPATVGASLATGSIVALLPTYGVASVTIVSGTTVLTPKNLCIVRDAWSGLVLTASNGRDIYALLQTEPGTIDGDTFNDINKRTQLSFVYEAVVNQTASLVLAPAAAVGGRSINYSYVQRSLLTSLPEDAYLSNNIFVDLPDALLSGTFATLADVTLQNAINNQVGTVNMNQNIAINAAPGTSWTYLSGTQQLWSLASSNSGNSLTINVSQFNVSSSNPVAFQSGIYVATGSTQINIGVSPLTGAISTFAGSNLVLSGGNRLIFGDSFGGGSTFPGGAVSLSNNTAEWNSYYTSFGNTSILGALNALTQSISSSATSQRTRYTAGVTTTTSPDVNITFPTNIDAQLGNYSTKNFVNNVNVYLNGILLLPGTSVSNPNDVYPGTSQVNGDLRFPMKLRSGSQITMEIF